MPDCKLLQHCGLYDQYANLPEANKAAVDIAVQKERTAALAQNEDEHNHLSEFTMYMQLEPLLG